MAFVPSLFISIGETGAFFTLRETYLHEQWVGGPGGYMSKEVRSFHHFNLSQDADEAIAKAMAAGVALGLQLTTTRDSLVDEMREIKRANAEEMQRREQAQREREALWAAEREAERARKIEMINKGIFGFGRLEGKPFRQADCGYLSWLIDMVDQFEPDSLMQLTAQAVKATCSDMALPKADVDAVVGTVGQRVEVDVTVTRVFTKSTDGMYGRPQWMYIITMVSSEGACIMSFSTAFRADVGDKLRIKGTVKKQERYKDQMQTVLQRIKVVQRLD